MHTRAIDIIRQTGFLFAKLLFLNISLRLLEIAGSLGDVTEFFTKTFPLSYSSVIIKYKNDYKI